MLRPGALLEKNFSNFLHDSSTPNKTVYCYFLTGEDNIVRFDFRRYTPQEFFTEIFFLALGIIFFSVGDKLRYFY